MNLHLFPDWEWLRVVTSLLFNSGAASRICVIAAEQPGKPRDERKNTSANFPV